MGIWGVDCLQTDNTFITKFGWIYEGCSESTSHFEYLENW
jgi:hypothetical protein